MKYYRCILICILVCFATPLFAGYWKEVYEDKFYWVGNLIDDVLCDYSLYYGKDNLKYLGVVLLTTGIMANTDIDRSFQKFWDKNIKSKTSDHILEPFEHIGFYPYPRVYIGSILLGYWARNYPFGNTLYQWGYRSLRGMFLVSPQITFFRNILGAGYPRARHYKKSHWRLFHRGRASCSGHTFNGALPFITAAMLTEKPVFKYGFYVLSVLPGLSRLNDNYHYLSQVVLGWSLSYLSARIVALSDEEMAKTYHICVQPLKDGAMVSASINF